MLCLVQLSKWRESKATHAEKVLSQWEKGAKCNFKSTAQVYERCFFFMKWNVFAMQKTDFHVLELFCRASHVRASMHRITSLELLSTLMMCLVQLSKWRECKAKDAEKLLSQWEKVANELFAEQVMLELQCTNHWFRPSKNTNAVFSATKQMKRIQGHGCWKASQWEKVAKCNFKSNAQVHERCFFLMKWNVICNAEDRFSCLELFLRAKNTNVVRAKNTNAVFSATKQMKRMQGQGCWKASFSVRERC